MKYNLRNYLSTFQRATAVHATRKVIVCRASPQFCNPDFLFAAVRELYPAKVVHLRMACEALASTGYVGAISSVDHTTREVTSGGCALITGSAFNAFVWLISFDVNKIPPDHAISIRHPLL